MIVVKAALFAAACAGACLQIMEYDVARRVTVAEAEAKANHEQADRLNEATLYLVAPWYMTLGFLIVLWFGAMDGGLGWGPSGVTTRVFIAGSAVGFCARNLGTIHATAKFEDYSASTVRHAAARVVTPLAAIVILTLIV